LRLGILGGTFNPIHLGHLRAAEEVWEHFGLEEVLFIIAAQPPHKDRAALLPFPHRYEMTRLACQEAPYFTVSNVEEARGGVSYSVETLEELHRRYRSQAEFFFIVGLDSFLEITTWHHYMDLFRLANVVVIGRPGFSWTKLKPMLRGDLALRRVNDETYEHPSGRQVHLMETAHLDISSTELRRMLAHGRSIKFLVPAAVESYIKRHKLYAGEGQDG